MKLVSELRRRNVFRMVVLYVVAAWLIMQVAEVVKDLASLPDWIGPTTLILLAVGFPIALAFSWFYEITPDGISLEKGVDSAESITHITGRRLDFLVISLLAAAVILFAFDKWWTSAPPENSIAVMAFVNMSGDTEQAYFSDGISEEILNSLAKIAVLRVISRSSAFSFRDKAFAIPEIAEQLNVAHILEGSVRRTGNRVRITAQLIDAHSDSPLWSETYDRSLGDIFAIQQEIAETVAKKLRVTLLGEESNVRTPDPDAYVLFLQALHLARTRTADGYEKSNELYEQALAIDPEYARAWDGLSKNYLNQEEIGERSNGEGNVLALEASRKALEIDPNFALAHTTLGWIEIKNDDLVAAAKHFERALELAPNNTAVIGNAGALLFRLGRIDDAIALEEYAADRDPVDPIGYFNLGLYYVYAYRWDEAMSAFETVLRLSPDFVYAYSLLSKSMLMNGEPKLALEAIEQESDESSRLFGLVLCHHALGEDDLSNEALAKLIEKKDHESSYGIASAFAYRNEVDQAFEWLANAKEHNNWELTTTITRDPLMENIQKDLRWLPFLDSLGQPPEYQNAIEFEVTLPQ